MKLKAPQEIMDHRSHAGRVEISMVKYVPIPGFGIEQHIDTGNGYQLRAQIAEKDWPEWVKIDRTARRAQELDDGLPQGAIAQAANSAKLAGVKKHKRK